MSSCNDDNVKYSFVFKNTNKDGGDLDTIVFLLLSMFDALAVVILMFKIFRQSLREHKYIIALLCAFSSCSSYLFRVVLDLSPVLDMVAQIMIFLLFNRFLLKVKVFYSWVMVAAGFGVFVALQMPVYYVATLFGVSESVAGSTGGAGVETIQILTDSAALIIGVIFKLFNLGFAFIVIPPHDFDIREKFFSGTNRLIIVSTFSLAVIITAALYITIHFNVVMFIYPLVLLALIILYYLSSRRDREDDD
ncbi:hypothetical protein SAMN04487969_11996 [Paenibacillus algorifonticola]|uniref:Uncharacterized protein n=2 Tax=Paenibacillus algorifonticola TaxID=684063 RepID=A0A1I2H374_9BACL|nr:hypothetical protein SAMN04487969_11996 [Paenibacillus algorifonticola]